MNGLSRSQSGLRRCVRGISADEVDDAPARGQDHQESQKKFEEIAVEGVDHMRVVYHSYSKNPHFVLGY